MARIGLKLSICLIFLNLIVCLGDRRSNVDYLDDDLPENYVDYRDMFNYDSSTKTMKPSKPESPCPPCVCPNATKESLNKEQSVNHSPMKEPTIEAPDAPGSIPSLDAFSANVSINSTCKTESQLSLVCVSTFYKLMRQILDVVPSDGRLDSEDTDAIVLRADIRLPVVHLDLLRRVVSRTTKTKDDRACRDNLWALQHFSAAMVKVRWETDENDVETHSSRPSYAALFENRQNLFWLVPIFAGIWGIWFLRRLCISSFCFSDALKLLVLLYVILFIVSLPWNGVALYQKAQVNQAVDRSQKLPPQCHSSFNEEDSSSFFLSVFTDVWKSLARPFQFGDPEQDACRRFHHAYQVDVITEVTPIRVLVFTINQMMFEPLEFLGNALGKFISGVFRDIPIHLWPVAVFVVFIFIIVASGYRLGLGFGLVSISPADIRTPTTSQMLTDACREGGRPAIAQNPAGQFIQRLGDENLVLKQELADLRGRLLLRLEPESRRPGDPKLGSSKPLYSSPFKDPTPLAIETVGGKNPSRTSRSHSAPDLKKIFFNPLPAPQQHQTVEHPSSSRLGTLGSISEEEAVEDTAVVEEAAGIQRLVENGFVFVEESSQSVVPPPEAMEGKIMVEGLKDLPESSMKQKKMLEPSLDVDKAVDLVPPGSSPNDNIKDINYQCRHCLVAECPESPVDTGILNLSNLSLDE